MSTDRETTQGVPANSTTPAPERAERWARACAEAGFHAWPTTDGYNDRAEKRAWTTIAHAAIALADEEAAARVDGDLWARYEGLRKAVEHGWFINGASGMAKDPRERNWRSETQTHVAALDTFVRSLIALAEARGTVPANHVVVPRDASVEMLACFTGLKPLGLRCEPERLASLSVSWRRALFVACQNRGAAAPQPHAAAPVSG